MTGEVDRVRREVARALARLAARRPLASCARAAPEPLPGRFFRREFIGQSRSGSPPSGGSDS